MGLAFPQCMQRLGMGDLCCAMYMHDTCRYMVGFMYTHAVLVPVVDLFAKILSFSRDSGKNAV